jgi:hypothetical protein
MSDKYNSKLAEVFRRIFSYDSKYYAVTIGQTTYYSAPESIVLKDIIWMCHENKHKEQYKKDGFIKFLVKYIYWSITKGYTNNPYEVEAREAEKNCNK